MEKVIPISLVTPEPIQEAIVADRSAESSAIALLTTQMAQGDEAAYREFYDTYFPRLRRYLLVVTGDETAAREAVQQTLVRVVRHVRTFHCELAFWSWLTVLARSSVIDETRKRRRYFAFLDRFWRYAQTTVGNDALEADVQLLKHLEKRLDGLCPEERHLIEQRYFVGSSIRDIAGSLDTTEKAVESKLARIRKKLKATLITKLKHEKHI